MTRANDFLIFLDFLASRMKPEQERQVIVFSADEANAYDGSLDEMSIEAAIQKLKNEADFIYADVEKTTLKTTEDKRTATANATRPLTETVLKQFKVRINDPDAFDDLRQGERKNTERGKKVPKLILKTTSGQLFKEGAARTKENTIKMKKGGFPYQSLYQMLTAKTYANARVLSLFLEDGDHSRVHQKIGKVKEMLAKKFDTSKEAYINSPKDGRGYKVRNIKIEKGV